MKTTNPKNPSPKQRYFLISYTVESDIYTGGGNLFFENDKFPNNKKLRKTAQGKWKSVGKTIQDTDVVIKNIFEFKNKEDYNNFIKEEDE